jgi:hypothetical protein
MANLAVECLYQDKKLSWARVFEEVIEQQAKLLRPKNLGTCLPGYLVCLYLAKEVLTKKVKNAYWLAKGGGDPDEEEEAKAKLEEEEEPEEKEAQEEEEVDVESSLVQEHTPSPQPMKRLEIVRINWSRKKTRKDISHLELSPSTSRRLMLEEQTPVGDMPVEQSMDFDFPEWNVPELPKPAKLTTMGEYQGNLDTLRSWSRQVSGFRWHPGP